MSEYENIKDTSLQKTSGKSLGFDTFVLDKGIFSNVFEKDVRRVYLYKKTERLAKALHLITPAFRTSPALRDRIDAIAIALVDAAVLPPNAAREALSRELLGLSSILAIARGSLLSAMNAELIAREAHVLLQEVASYEEPRLFFDDAPTLAALAKSVETPAPRPLERVGTHKGRPPSIGHDIGQTDAPARPQRQDAILGVLRSKGPSYIKDISTVIRDVSEKTIQRELAALVSQGQVTRTGERRWTSYSLVENG